MAHDFLEKEVVPCQAPSYFLWSSHNEPWAWDPNRITRSGLNSSPMLSAIASISLLVTPMPSS